MIPNLSLEYGPQVPDNAVNLAWISFPEASPHSNVHISNVVKSLPSYILNHEKTVPYESINSYDFEIRGQLGATPTTQVHRGSTIGRLHSPVEMLSAYVDASGAWRPKLRDGLIHAEFVYSGSCKLDTEVTTPVVVETDPSWLSQIRIAIQGTATFTSASDTVTVVGGSITDIEVGDYLDAGELGDWYVLSVAAIPNSTNYTVTVKSWPGHVTSSGTSTLSRRLRKGQLLHAVYTIPEFMIGSSSGNRAISFQESAVVVDDRTVKVASPTLQSLIEVTLNGVPQNITGDSTDCVVIGRDGTLTMPAPIALSDEVLVTYYYLEPSVVYNGYYETLSDGTKIYHDLNLNPEYGHTYDNGRDTSELLGYVTTLFMLPSSVCLMDELVNSKIVMYRACDFGETQLLRWTSRQIQTLYNVHEYAPWNIQPWTECSIQVSPTSKALIGGEQCEFSATVVNGVDPSVRWYVDSGSRGSVIQLPRHGRTTKCIYTAPNTAGSYNLVAEHATAPNVKVTVPITVVVHADDEAYVDWISTPSQIRVEESVVFEAKAFHTTDQSVVYSLGPGSVGNIDNDGIYTAPATGGGSVTVIATSTEDNSATASVSYTIQTGVTGVEISASVIVIAPGATSVITAKALCDAGFSLPDDRVTWQIVEGSQAGTISDAGPSHETTFTATSDPDFCDQVYTIRATSNLDGNYVANIYITIGSPAPTSPVRPVPDIRAGYYGSARYEQHRYIERNGEVPPQ